jgi:hydroxymethylbilane synthase
MIITFWRLQLPLTILILQHVRKLKRDFLRRLFGGCSTPISAFAEIKDDCVLFKGNILSLDGKEKAEIEMAEPLTSSIQLLGIKAAEELLKMEAKL